jgi:Spy/CpxP family protein refolding chaperone
MKKLGLLLMIVVLGTTISMAQNRGGQGNYDPVESAKKQTATLKKELNLNKEQEKKVYTIVLDGANKMDKMRKEMRNGSGDRDAMRAKFGELRKEQNREMKKILTDEQYIKYEKYLEERRARRQGRGGNR